jgi:uroporphyrinogen-III synthase
MVEQPLAGKRIGVTATRKAEEQIALLRRRGAEVLHAPCVRYVVLDEDPDLRAATERLLADGMDLLVVTTGMGLRGWLDAAEHWGIREDLLQLLGHTEIMARGPKAAGMVRSIGLRESYTPPTETDAELLAHIRERTVAGQRIAVQAHGEALPEFSAALRADGARLVELLPYRWEQPDDLGPVLELADAVLRGEIDAITFTSAPAAATLLAVAARYRAGSDFPAKLGAVTLACVGSVTAKPLQDKGFAVNMPERSRTGTLITELGEWLAG